MTRPLGVEGVAVFYMFFSYLLIGCAPCLEADAGGQLPGAAQVTAPEYIHDSGTFAMPEMPESDSLSGSSSCSSA